jgi:hypothetical protein
VTLRIADDGVTSNKILDSTISSADLAANSVHNNQIATGAVGASEIATDAVGMTVLLTPLDAGSKGLAVTGKSATGFEVQELRQGSGTYDFDWEVKSVRKGQENYRVLRNKSEIVSAEATGKAEDGQRQQQSTQH